jgi:hypothetical protein
VTASTVASAVAAKPAGITAGAVNVDAPAFSRKVTTTSPTQNGSDVIKLKKLSVLTAGEDEDKYEIPTFLRKQVEQ